MGIEDYGLIMMPLMNNKVSKTKIERELVKIGFKHYDELYNFDNKVTLKLDSKSGIIEILLKIDNENIEYLSCRFAVCQPIMVVDQFFDIIVKLSKKYQLNIQEGYSQKIFDINSDYHELYQMIFDKVKHLKSNWIKIFNGDDEEIIISVNKSWGYYLAKHPSILKSREQTAKQR